MNRREFLHVGAAGMALSAAGTVAAEFADAKAPRVGLIGCGWYGKNDLFRLIQVAPVEVVSLCDVDKNMLAAAADMVAAAPAIEEEAADLRRLPGDAEGEGPGHRAGRHARPLACPADDRGRRGRRGCLRQKPISVDVVEGQAMVAAARKHKRVVQVGTQRRSTPHLVEARDRHHQGRQAREDRPRRDLLLLPHAVARQPRRRRAAGVSRLRNVDRPGADDGRTIRWSIRGKWRTFMEYGNGIVGDMCIHMLDMVRWMLDLGWPKSVSSSGGIFVDKGSKANISDTQIGDVRFRRSERRLAAPHLGQSARRRNTPGRRSSTATRERSRPA